MDEGRLAGGLRARKASVAASEVRDATERPLRALATAGAWLRWPAGRRRASGSSRARVHGSGVSGSPHPSPVPVWPGRRAGGGDRFRRLAASLLVAIVASAFGAPALAQITPAHCTSDPLELWCASLTVGSTAAGTLGYASTEGSLTRTLFTHQGVTYTIGQLVSSPNSTPPGLTLTLNPNGNMVFNNDDAPVAGFALRIGTKDFSLRDSSFGSGAFSWNNPGLSWSAGDRVPVKLIRANQPIRVRDIEFSDPGPDNLYTHGENLEITVTFGEPLNIPDAVLQFPNYVCEVDERPKADVKRGNGTNRIVFGCKIAGGPYTRVYLEANRLRPGSGGDGARVFELHPAVEKTTAVHGLVGPGITGVSVGSPGSDGLWTDGETLEVRYAFSGPVTVATGSGTPRVWVRHIFIDPADRSFERADFRRVENGNTLVFSSTVRGRPREAFKVAQNSMRNNGGVIVGTGDGALADLSHAADGLGPPCGTFPDELWCTTIEVGTSTVEAGQSTEIFRGARQVLIGILCQSRSV